ncbi:MAG: hypothetical protein IJX27_04115 [Clostridia bacterium]|nr:hypothetical protein [Clostridia bacterium]
MKIRIYENGVIKEEFTEEGFVCSVRCGDMNAYNIGEGRFSPCTTREIFVGGENVRIRITTSPDLADIMEIMKRFPGVKLVAVEKGNVKVEIEV